MQKIELTVNNRIEVIKDEKYYKALIVDVEEDYIKINIPVYNDEYLMLYRGDKIEINTSIQEGNCYKFNCDVISKGRDNNVIYYKLTIPYNVKKIQRRNYVRVQVIKPIEYKNITDVKENIDEIPYNEAIMVDLSGGGLKIKTPERLKKGNKVMLRLQLENSKIEVKGDIVRAESTPDNQRLCGVRFLEISQSESDKIIRELFEIMRKQRANR